jgi:hypothetical protein
MMTKLSPQSAKLLADIRDALAMNEQQRKVIEAAKALHEARQMRYGWKRDKAEEAALFAMDDAVEALASLTK